MAYLDDNGLAYFWDKIKAYVDSHSGGGSGEGGVSSYFGTCSTVAGTAAKVVTCAEFALEKGAFIAVFFSTANTANTPTLNINNTGAKQVYIQNHAGNGTGYPIKWDANTTVYFIYDGTHYQFLGIAPGYSNAWYGTCSTADTTLAKVVSCPNFRLQRGSLLAVCFSTANTNTTSNITLNVNATGAKQILFHGNQLSNEPLPWGVDDVLLFMYTGSSFQYVGGTNAMIGVSADYVIEDGGAGNWSWRKWSNGRIEAWGWGSFTSSGSSNGSWVGYMDTPVTMMNSSYYVWCQVNDYRHLKAYVGERSTTQFRVALGSTDSATGDVFFYLVGYYA